MIEERSLCIAVVFRIARRRGTGSSASVERNSYVVNRTAAKRDRWLGDRESTTTNTGGQHVASDVFELRTSNREHDHNAPFGTGQHYSRLASVTPSNWLDGPSRISKRALMREGQWVECASHEHSFVWVRMTRSSAWAIPSSVVMSMPHRDPDRTIEDAMETCPSGYH